MKTDKKIEEQIEEILMAGLGCEKCDPMGIDRESVSKELSELITKTNRDIIRGFVETLKLNKHIFYTKGLGKEIQEEADIYLTQQSLDKGDGE